MAVIIQLHFYGPDSTAGTIFFKKIYSQRWIARCIYFNDSPGQQGIFMDWNS
jgi:hypothetical protein